MKFIKKLIPMFSKFWIHLVILICLLVLFYFLGNPIRQPFSSNDSNFDITAYIQPSNVSIPLFYRCFE